MDYQPATNNSSNDDITNTNTNTNKLQIPQKISVQEYIPIYNTKFISLLRQTKNTDTTAINTIANTIIDLFKSHHTRNNKDSNKDSNNEINNIQTYYNNYYNNTDEYDDLKQLSTHTIKPLKPLKTYKHYKTDNKSLLKYSIECMLNSSNSTDIIFYNIYIQDLICVISFLSNLGYILSKNIMDTDNNPYNPYNPFMLAYTYLLDLGVSPTICDLIKNLLYINIDNYKNNNILNYNNIQIKSLEQLKNIEPPEYNNIDNNNNNDNDELLNIIHNCMNTRLMNIYENDINLYLNGYVKHKLITVLTWF